MSYPLRIGLLSIGLQSYWSQFPELRDRLTGYNRTIEERLSRDGVEVINLGLIESVDQGVEAGHSFRRSDIDVIFVHAATYALSYSVLPVVRRANVPVIVLNLAPEKAIDYASFNRLKDRTAMTGEWLAHCGGCAVPELANVLHRAGLKFFEVVGTIENDPIAWGEVADWIDAARVANSMAHNRLGLMGHYYGGMLDISTDLTRVSSVFGCQIEMLEVDELGSLRGSSTRHEIEKQIGALSSIFDIQDDCDPSELRRAASTSVALDKLVEAHRLNSLAYYYSGSGNPANEDVMSSIILGTSLLTARNVPVAGEYEVKNVLAMKIMDEFGAGGSFTEFYAADFNADEVLLGHDGPGHLAIAEGKAKVRPLREYHGKVGSGLSIEMRVKCGPVTLLSIAEDTKGSYKMIIAEGHSVPGQILEIGNTNSRYRFSLGAREFVKAWNSQGPAHHCAVGVGHVAVKIEKLAALLDIPAVRVC